MTAGTRAKFDKATLDARDQTELEVLTHQVAVGRGLALSLGALAERASFAERETRAASWEDPDAIAHRVAKAQQKDADTNRVLQEMASGELTPAGDHVNPDDLNPEAARATDDAIRAVQAAFTAVGAAHQAVLAAQLSSARQQEAEDGGKTHRRTMLTSAMTRHSGALVAAVRSEVTFLLARKPRKVLRAILIAVLSGAAYLVYIRLFEWHTYGKWAPYLAVLFISSVMGTSACFNSFAFDARRVRVALDGGARLWQILVVKNLALMVVVFPLGLAMCLALAFLTGRPAALLASIALVLSILMLWSGVGNLLSVVLPLRDAPLKVHRKEGTLKQFLVEFAVTWGVSYVVMFLLIWRVYSAKGMGERYGSTLIAVLLLVVSAGVAWLNFTVIATAFTNQPGVYRRLRRELDWQPTPPADPDDPAVASPAAATTAAPEADSAADSTAPPAASTIG